MTKARDRDIVSETADKMTIKESGSSAGGGSATPSPNNIGQGMGQSSSASSSSNPKRTHTIMSAEDAAAGKRSFWAEMELTGETISNIKNSPLFKF